ncbi:MAG: ribonuclease P protein component [Actinobacteria bacterium]|nr:ribonuclease P protein component [Actinomycetota bacterium]
MPNQPPRIRSKETFNRLYEQAKKLITPVAVIFINPSPQHASGFVASKKVGGAVSRNRARRVLKEFYRHHYHQIIPSEIIWVARRHIVKTPFHQMQQDLIKCLKKNELWIEKNDTYI